MAEFSLHLSEEQRELRDWVHGFANDVLEIEIAPDRRFQVPLAQVQKANLKFEW